MYASFQLDRRATKLGDRGCNSVKEETRILTASPRRINCCYVPDESRTSVRTVTLSVRIKTTYGINEFVYAYMPYKTSQSVQRIIGWDLHVGKSACNRWGPARLDFICEFRTNTNVRHK